MLGIKIDYDRRIYGYDFIRALAIFCVVRGHGAHLLNDTILEGFPWIPLPRGVDIFFVLSGFLIGYSFMVFTSGTSANTVGQKALNFWKRSVLRILPNYYLILALNYVLVNNEMLNGSTEQFGWFYFATFTQNLFTPFYDFFWESWSLAVQEWFYFLFPVLLIVAARIWSIKKSVLIISLVFLILPVVYRFYLTVQHEYDGFWWDVSIRKVVATRIDCIFYGVLIAWVKYFYTDVWKRFALHAFMLGSLIFVLMQFIPKSSHTLYQDVFYLSISPIYIALWFPLLDNIKDVKSIFGRIVTTISILSYAIYLLNLLLIQLIDLHFKDDLTGFPTLKYALYWLTTLTASYLLYRLFEHPIASRGNKWLSTTRMMYKKLRQKQRLEKMARTIRKNGGPIQ